MHLCLVICLDLGLHRRLFLCVGVARLLLLVGLNCLMRFGIWVCLVSSLCVVDLLLLFALPCCLVTCVCVLRVGLRFDCLFLCLMFFG